MNKKLIIILSVIIVLIISVVTGSILILNSQKTKESKTLSVQYVGGDKFIGQSVKTEDFQVVYLPTNSRLQPTDFMIENVVLDLEGTPVTIMYTTPEGNMVQTQVMVYPTLTISSITASLGNQNKFIGSTLTPEDFKVAAIDNKGNSYNLTNFTISPTLIETEETDVTITYEHSGSVFTSVVHIKTVPNYFVDLNVQYIGNKNYIGENVINEDLLVTAIMADGQQKEQVEFSIINPLLKEETNEITVSAVNEHDEVISKDIIIEAKNYVTQIASIHYIGDTQTVGNTVSETDFEVYGLKSDNTKVKLNNFKIESLNKLETTHNVIRISYYNELGNILSGECTVKADDNIIFIGDSRVAGLERLYGNTQDVCYYIYDENANFEWFRDVAIPAAQAIMDKNIYTKYRIVVNIGLFDNENVDKYCELYRDLAQNKWNKHKMYIISLNPIDEEQMDTSGIYSRSVIDTAKIKEFNLNLSSGVNSDITNLKYVNTNGSIINQGFKTVDGINYEDGTYHYYYNLVKSMTY